MKCNDFRAVGRIRLTIGILLSATILITPFHPAYPKGIVRVTDLAVIDAMPDTDPAKGLHLERLAETMPLSNDTEINERIKTHIRAAKLLEGAKRPLAVTSWMHAASLEVRFDAVDVGMQHAHHALALFDTLGDGNYYPLNFDTPILRFLVDRGKIDLADQLLAEAIEKVQKRYGPKSAATQWILGDAFVYNLERGRKDAAVMMLDRLLLCDMTTGRTPEEERDAPCTMRVGPADPSAQLMIRRLRNAVISLSPFDPELAESVQLKILKAQRAALPVDDERLVETMAYLSAFYVDNNRKDEAQKYYDEALRIALKYNSPEDARKYLWGRQVNIGDYNPVSARAYFSQAKKDAP